MSTTVMSKEIEHWPTELVQELKKAGRSLWLAGLGVVQVVDESGRELVSRLVERGRRLEVPDLEGRLRTGGEKIRDFGLRAERGFEARMSRTLERFGVPSRDDVKVLGDRIEELTRKVECLKN